MAPNDRFVAETSLRTRYAETDSMGIVHHSQYIIYFEEGRSEYARQRGRPYSEFEQGGYFLTVTEVNVRYIQPTRYEQIITIHTWIAEMKSRSVTFSYEILDQQTGSALVTGQTKHICINREGKVTRIPDTWREWGKT